MRIYLYLLCVFLLLGCPGVNTPGVKKEVPVTPKGKSTPVAPKGKEPTEDEKKAAAEKKAATARLLTAVKANDVGKVNEALEAGANVNARDVDGWPVLTEAAYNGRKAIAKVLIDKGADVNARTKAGDTALMMANLNSRTAIVTLLRAAGATE